MFSPAPTHFYRLIPSKFPPIGLFDTVATAADAEAVRELARWTNDRLVEERLRRLPREEWAYGRANSSVVMAAFLRAPLAGARFNGPDLGAWYASAALWTAAFEVGHHLRREAVATDSGALERDYRAYTGGLDGSYLDIRGQQEQRADSYEPCSCAASQAMGECIRSSGGWASSTTACGIVEGLTSWPTALGTSSGSPRLTTGAWQLRLHLPKSG